MRPVRLDVECAIAIAFGGVMFKLALHEHSPRVTLLQILLKDEYPLRVDGIFGPKTHSAVAQFQTSRREPPSGSPSPTTWKNLLDGTDLAIVSSIDAGDPGVAQADGRALEEAGDKPILLAAMCNGLAELVAQADARSAGQRIAALRLDGHGNLGRWMTISVGEVVDLAEERPAEYRKIAEEYFSYIDFKHFQKIEPVLAKLSGKFAPFGFVEHHGCSLGSRYETRKMMAKLADLWEVPVSAGKHLQPFGRVADFVGPVFTAYPLGMNLYAWSRQFQNTVVRTMSVAPRTLIPPLSPFKPIAR